MMNANVKATLGYIRTLSELHGLQINEEADSPTGDMLSDRLDGYWASMDADDRDFVRKVSGLFSEYLYDKI